MTDGKMLGILDNLKDQYKREAKDREDKEILFALEMATELLTRGIDLASENEQLKAKLDDSYAKCNAMAAESVKYKDAATDEARCSANLKAEVRILKECITLICREVCR
jgi:hypothetical protein